MKSKKKYNYITELSGDEQKKVAIKMWQYIRKWYREHPSDFRHPMDLKHEFAEDYLNKTDITINWNCYCMFCSIFYDNHCEGCPLAKCDEYGGNISCPDYTKLCDPQFPRRLRDRVCRTILDAFKSYNYDKE